MLFPRSSQIGKSDLANDFINNRAASFWDARFLPGWLPVLLGSVLGVANIVFLSPDPSHSLIRFYDRLFVPFCAYWLVRLITPTNKDLQRFVVVAFITLVIECIIGLISTVSPGSVPHQWLGEAGERTTGTFGNPAVYSSTLIFLSIFLLQYCMQGRSRKIGTLFLLTFGLVYLCVFFSFSRG